MPNDKPAAPAAPATPAASAPAPAPAPKAKAPPGHVEVLPGVFLPKEAE